jgi:hypothetical protein
MQTNANGSSTDILEYNLKISRPTEKMLEKQRRNKRKSKIFLERKQTNSDEEIASCTNIESHNFYRPNKEIQEEKKFSTKENSEGINKINFSDEDYYYSPKNHVYTLELFKCLSVEEKPNDDTNQSSTGKENTPPRVNSITEILRELSAEREEKTSTSSSFASLTQPSFSNNYSKNKMLFSEKFKSTCCKDSFPSKRFKI